MSAPRKPEDHKRPARVKPKPKLRLVKVAVQPSIILDHGTHVEEVEHPVIVIPASEWPEYSGERFPRELAEWQAQLDATT
jgi:hypothetical protein